MLRPDRLGLALRYLRNQRNLRQRDVAERAGITGSMLSGYENGKKLPALGSLDKILQAMGFTLRELVDVLEGPLPGDPPPDPDAPPAPRSALPPPVVRGSGRPSMPPLHFDLAAIFGASSELQEEEEQAFGEMLKGYCRWLRYLREMAAAREPDEDEDPEPRSRSS
ncbi:MAG: helix-turn-helix transcriptional regulator [Acidobacteriota bacterium]|nr:helix-turn-helix transcriptional regulator [Acidobacteriota bacterium]